MEGIHRNPFRVREAIRFIVGWGLTGDKEYHIPEAIDIINKFYFLMDFGGGYTLESIEEMRNIEYLMLLKCREHHNKRMNREAENAGKGSSFIDKKAIGASENA